MDKVNDDHKPVMITRQNGKPTVVISLGYFMKVQDYPDFFRKAQ
ncbi:conserved hypothetical protein [Photorhabdus asymbiotica]|uniref:Prevent-host-death family protein n=1 Tax=Photorhabdus asymbiotica subsp. asymbiotica (strain ATCC 43949 / 3105-77) TaxID=553480 RepID=B6VLQ0_PHOAA|nr:conserved hypothetical protein [Photorhabdus asymbiotica]CAR67080.1 prevent-host-death protein [Photorhabdus asymbiotica subsp. asymbiotica ATCC 43949]